ncbi:MAG: flagellar basal body P-ring formation chaperone FlgA [Candidatus Zixiibacteriota bacterium]
MTLFKRILAVLIFLVPSICPGVTSLTPSEVILDEIMVTYELDPLVYEIEVLTNQLKTESLEGRQLTFRPLSQKEPIGLFTVLATVLENGEEIESNQVRLRIKKYKTVLVVKDRVGRNDNLSPEQFGLERMEVTNLTEMPLESVEQIEGYRASRNLRPGQILTSGAIEPIPDVESGRETLIVYDDGLCKITATGIALQSGVTGDYVKVKNKATKKIIMARVIDENAVSVDP